MCFIEHYGPLFGINGTYQRTRSRPGSVYRAALAVYSNGSVLLAEGDAQSAQARLREAWMLCQQLEMPYESACVCVLLGQVCLWLDDRETARIHFEAARAVFERLEAAPALAQLERLTAGGGFDGALTRREREVLSLVAAGQSNRQIAAGPAISEHTVARHMSNIFNKLAVNSRAAASSYARAHKLI